MVHARLHIICGNCGQDLKEPGMATREYIPIELDTETGEVINPATVFIRCKNCATLHSIDDSITKEEPREPLKNIDKIKAMAVYNWREQIEKDEHLTPTLCFMCVGCEKCGENCAAGVEEWLEKEIEES